MFTRRVPPRTAVLEPAAAAASQTARLSPAIARRPNVLALIASVSTPPAGRRQGRRPPERRLGGAGRLPGELPTSRRDVPPARQADGRRQARGVEDRLEARNRLARGAVV